MKKYLITICARGGSKGIPGKNIRHLNGKPLIYYTFKHAQELKEYLNADIQLSSDSDEIISTLVQVGYVTQYKRPSELATDTAGKLEVIKDALIFAENHFNTEYDYVIDLDVTSPLRNCQDLIQAARMLEEDAVALNIFSVNVASRNPYFNMVEVKSDGYYHLVKNESKILTRQSAPAVYDMNASFYIYRRNFFNTKNITAISEKSLIYVMPHICFDLDHEVDFEFMEYLMKYNKLGFDL
ncbi:MAG: acylneuraminate cytidylyltransferase family protein [Ignavibacteriaceae bacterium]|nr:acylneuraminate cytidylyltransferase family protein [Ignavibacteriaceae bacterium]